ncbi:MAG: alpha/beta fold hydrolase [Myxococcales bacterium]|nr:alpha/beta fold hydrolase [Myxococcales bacterium]
MKRARRIAIALALLLGLAHATSACSASSRTPSDGGPAGDADASAAACAEVIFDPLQAPTVTPFPSNFWTKADATTRTGLRIDIVAGNHPADDAAFSLYPELRDQLGELDGFGTMAGIVFRFSGPVGERFAVAPDATTKASSPIVLVELASGEAVPLLLETVEDTKKPLPNRVLIAQPLVPLRAKTTYAAMIRASAVGAANGCLAPSPLMRRVIDEDTAELTLDGYKRLAPDVPRAKKALVDAGFIAKPDELAALTIFTTQSIREPMAAIIEDVDAYAQSTGFTISNVVDNGPSSTSVGHHLSGRFKSIDYRDPTSGRISFDSAGKPRRAGFNDLGFELYIPATSVAAPPYPIAILIHGLNGDRNVGSFAELFAAKGVAAIAIDAPHHGERAKVPLLAVLDFFAVDIATKSFAMFKARDNFRQAYAELLQLSRLVTRVGGLDLLPATQPDGTPEIMASEIIVAGHSLGGILGSGLLAIDARCPMGILTAGGAGLTNILLESGLFGTFILGLKPAGTSDADVRSFFPLLQTLFERGDPGNFASGIQRTPWGAPGATTLKHVLYPMVENDKFVPNLPNEALARAAGVPQVPPVLHAVPGLEVTAKAPLSANGREGKTAAYFQYDIVNGSETATHTNLTGSPEARAQLSHWLETYLATGTPEVIDPYVTLGVKKP